MSKHTRGPWRYIWPKSEDGSIRIDSPVDTRPVAYVDNGRRADAFLIAAAPDLAAAAEATLLWHDADEWDKRKHLRWFELTGSKEVETKVLCDFVRAAIAKATGEETES